MADDSPTRPGPMVLTPDPAPVVAIPRRPRVPCSATTSAGKPCRKFAIVGGTVCATHGGSAPQVKAAAARRIAQAKAAASLAEVDVTPIDDPVAELVAVAEEARAWQRHLADQVAELGGLTMFTEHGEQARAAVQLYERAMDRVAKFLEVWVRLGMDERVVRIQERQVALVARAVEDTFAELGVDVATAGPVLRRHLEAAA